MVEEGRIRVEIDPALCGCLNEDVGHLCGVTEPQIKSCVLVCLLLCSYLYLSLTGCWQDPLVSRVFVGLEVCPPQIYFTKHQGTLVATPLHRVITPFLDQFVSLTRAPVEPASERFNRP